MLLIGQPNDLTFDPIALATRFALAAEAHELDARLLEARAMERIVVPGTVAERNLTGNDLRILIEAATLAGAVGFALTATACEGCPLELAMATTGLVRLIVRAHKIAERPDPLAYANHIIEPGDAAHDQVAEHRRDFLADNPATAEHLLGTLDPPANAATKADLAALIAYARAMQAWLNEDGDGEAAFTAAYAADATITTPLLTRLEALIS